MTRGAPRTGAPAPRRRPGRRGACPGAPDAEVPASALEVTAVTVMPAGEEPGDERDDIVCWTFFEGDNVPHAVVPVYLQSVPAGSNCKVFLIRNNTAVKGSTTSYTVD